MPSKRSCCWRRARQSTRGPPHKRNSRWGTACPKTRTNACVSCILLSLLRACGPSCGRMNFYHAHLHNSGRYVDPAGGAKLASRRWRGSRWEGDVSCSPWPMLPRYSRQAPTRNRQARRACFRLHRFSVQLRDPERTRTAMLFGGGCFRSSNRKWSGWRRGRRWWRRRPAARDSWRKRLRQERNRSGRCKNRRVLAFARCSVGSACYHDTVCCATLVGCLEVLLLFPQAFSSI